MGFFDLFKTASTVDTAVNAIVKGADALVLTDEERINYNLKAAELHLKLTEQVGKESTPTSISRRIVAMTVLVPFVFLKVGSAVIYLIGSLGDEINGSLINVSTHWNLAAQDFSIPAGAVVVFYFGGHIASKLKK